MRASFLWDSLLGGTSPRMHRISFESNPKQRQRSWTLVESDRRHPQVIRALEPSRGAERTALAVRAGVAAPLGTSPQGLVLFKGFQSLYKGFPLTKDVPLPGISPYFTRRSIMRGNPLQGEPHGPVSTPGREASAALATAHFHIYIYIYIYIYMCIHNRWEHV